VLVSTDNWEADGLSDRGYRHEVHVP
jgi:hypothetical protein